MSHSKSWIWRKIGASKGSTCGVIIIQYIPCMPSKWVPICILLQFSLSKYFCFMVNFRQVRLNAKAMLMHASQISHFDLSTWSQSGIPRSVYVPAYFPKYDLLYFLGSNFRKYSSIKSQISYIVITFQCFVFQKKFWIRNYQALWFL